jgi:hypothetical protein
MPKPPEIARSLEDFLTIVANLEENGWGLWFRGQASAEWGLVPVP